MSLARYPVIGYHDCTMTKHFTNEDLRADIRKRIARSSLRKVAAELGFSAPYLHNVLAGHRIISERLGNQLGYIKLPRPKAVRPPQMWARGAKQEHEK